MSQPDAAQIPVLAALKPRDRDTVLGYAKQRTYAPGDTVMREGDGSLYLFLIASGHARVLGPDGAIAAVLPPGSFFGELGLIEEHPRTATVVADEELTCVLLPAWEFRSLLTEHPEMAVPMVHELIRRLHRMSPHQH